MSPLGKLVFETPPFGLSPAATRPPPKTHRGPEQKRIASVVGSRKTNGAVCCSVLAAERRFVSNTSEHADGERRGPAPT